MRCRILVVEDSATQAEALRTLLEEEGHDVAVARSAEEALERIAPDRFDLVLSDIVMPGMNGWELCRRLKSEPGLRDIPLVLLTSLTDPMDIVRGLECGADNYITKPYDPEHLLARVRRVLDNRRLRSGTRTSMGVNISFLGTTFTITSEKEQILDLLLSSIEDVVRTNRALQESQRELAEVHAQLEVYASEKAHEAEVSTEMYRTLMQNAGDAIFVLDREGRIREGNAPAARLLGIPAREMEDRFLDDFVVDEEREEFRARLEELSEDRILDASEWRLRCSGGPVIHCEVSASMTRIDGDGLMLVIVRDITERKQAEEALRDTNQRLQALVSGSPLAILTTDLALKVTSWNPAAEEIFGFSEEEVVGQRLPIVPEALADESRWVVERIFAGEGCTNLETRRQRKDGTLVDVSLSTAPLRSADGRIMGILALLADISEHKRAEQALLQSEEQLRQAQKMEAVGRLAGGIAHDFNNMLTAIKGYTEMLMIDLADHPAQEDLAEIRKSTDRATSLTRQLLAFSRKQVLQPEVLDLNAVITNTENLLHRLIGEDVELEVRTSPSLGRVRTDRGQIEQVLMNLVVNARDAMPRGGRITIETRNVEARAEEVPPGETADPGPHVLLSVSDTGTGMDEETLSHVFEPFFTTKLPGKGTGLGLATVYGIVRQSGGFIRVESAPGAGTTFRIYLPHARGAEAEEGVQHAPSLPERTGSETVLLVVGEAAVRALARKILEKQGYRVLEAGEGEEALRVVEGHPGPIHLLITDMVLPRMSGREIAERIRRTSPEVRVLYMSGYRGGIGAHPEVPGGGTELLEKPFTAGDLVRRVQEVLDQHVSS
ncbi:MAG TPA: PAS domain S-box protein [Longimicrobiaceae bacterium]|nr:PAS domain S-box protein [Longimicrobiaceae bacterium]